MTKRQQRVLRLLVAGRWSGLWLAGMACLAIPALGAGRSAADETVLLDDLAFPGRFQMDPWNKAPGRTAADGEARTGAATGPSLRVTIDWPAGDEFRFFSLQPGTTRGPIPYRLREVALWAKSAGDGRFLEVHFTDADGEARRSGGARSQRRSGSAW